MNQQQAGRKPDNRPDKGVQSRADKRAKDLDKGKGKKKGKDKLNLGQKLAGGAFLGYMGMLGVNNAVGDIDKPQGKVAADQPAVQQPNPGVNPSKRQAPAPDPVWPGEEKAKAGQKAPDPVWPGDTIPEPEPAPINQRQERQPSIRPVGGGRMNAKNAAANVRGQAPREKERPRARGPQYSAPRRGDADYDNAPSFIQRHMDRQNQRVDGQRGNFRF